ncbi:MAG: GAF domain-containing protein [Bacteroidetes bacterium]|nr:GAF domain-containing protein [Bacteroidota bacterium]
MDLKSIENLDIVNLSNCDSEPIHIPGSIQPHGFLLAINSEYIVKFCSRNLPSFGLQFDQVLDKKMSSFIDEAQFESLIKYLDNRVFESSKPHVLKHGDVLFNNTVHVSGPYFILELEPFPDGSLELPELYLQTKKFTTILSRAIGLQQLCQYISDEIKDITGYDRVMIYRFDEDYNGEVFAESKNTDLESFLGLHYPHTDIPKQARELYIKNLMRMIVDVDYTPVPILTLDTAASNQNLDLSQSVLRSVSPIHIEYLKNMGVHATLTISLISDNKLWGLIACHHYSAKNLPHYIRLSALLQGHFLTSQIHVQEVAADYALKITLDNSLKNFLSLLDTPKLAGENNIVCAALCELTNSNGVSLIDENTIYSYGDVPLDVEIKQLAGQLSATNINYVFSNNIKRDYSINFSNDVAGLLYYKLDENTAIIWFRNELKKEKKWAGDPEKAIVKDSNGLSPRKSFAVWKEKVTNFSSDWLEAEVLIANQAVYAIQKHLSINRARRVENSQSILLQKLRDANEELENINWISTHDLKEPLRKISIFSSMLLDTERFSINEDATYLVNRVASSAEKMQYLIDGLMAFSRVKNVTESFELTDLNNLLNDVLCDNEDLIKEKNITITTDTLPEIYCIPLLIRQLFSNIIINSIKFSRTDTSAQINVRCTKLYKDGQNFAEITFADNGVGFDNQYKDLIFQVFQQLDKALTIDNSGTGIGLAICKKIVDAHKGRIFADGTLNEGATFTIQLPYNPAFL